MSEIIWYEHHDKQMAVQKENKGKHRDNSLCYSCAKFKPQEQGNCTIAQTIFVMDVALEVTTPVWECASFAGKEPIAPIERIVGNEDSNS